ncbi:HNH endonuclease [Celeribacter sp. HF31]|uniref:HNH endonuclease n=1 Tax=Celeribacter sp. HF31 TaxID=2721558 RepID=UPI0014302E53|nr:HNH endonuclease [Celeribacter sp. HF31]NIY77926.1 HNH endonuclease [Celeribacter sp. HF31]
MKAYDIKKYLKSSRIMGRKSTFSNAFASALAPFDEYSESTVNSSITDLGQNPEDELTCVYCDAPAATWDHVFNRVIAGEFSGYGHRIRNLVPSCRTCNERKGKKNWRDFIIHEGRPNLENRIARMEKFLSADEARPTTMDDIRNAAQPELDRFLEIRSEVFRLLEEADAVAKSIRQKL